jgi:small-conductance mechanosensitive channel
MHLADFNTRSLAVFLRSHAEQIVAAAVKIAVILAGYFIVRAVVFRLINRVFGLRFARGASPDATARAARVRALQTVLRSATGFVLGLVAAIMLLQAAGINIAPLLMSASVAGLAVGFGAQRLVRDVIAGFFILMEDQYGVGDYVTIGAVTGTVEELGMRITRLRDADGKLYILPNGDIAQVCNHSRGRLRTSMEITLPATTDIEKAGQVLNEVGKSVAGDMPSRILEPYKCDGVVHVTGTAITLRMVGSVVPEHEEAVRLQMNSRIRQAFQENGLQLA